MLYLQDLTAFRFYPWKVFIPKLLYHLRSTAVSNTFTGYFRCLFLSFPAWSRSRFLAVPFSRQAIVSIPSFCDMSIMYICIHLW